MSRQLPAHPNLEYLKNEAKDLLDELRREHPEAKLADAQFTLARLYGFDSWPKLKAHVDSVATVAAAAAASAVTALHAFAGTWKANITRSRPHPLNPVQSAMLTIEVTEDGLMIRDIVRDRESHEEQHVNTIVVDGVQRLFPHGYGVTATWRGHGMFETLATKDGEVVGWGKYETVARWRDTHDYWRPAIDPLRPRAATLGVHPVRDVRHGHLAPAVS
jgi:hypothetical protein